MSLKLPSEKEQSLSSVRPVGLSSYSIHQLVKRKPISADGSVDSISMQLVEDFKQRAIFNLLTGITSCFLHKLSYLPAPPRAKMSALIGIRLSTKL